MVKILALFALVAVVSAGNLGLYGSHHHVAAPLLVSAGHYGHYDHHDDHHDAPAHYQFSYGVKDAHTGDIKEQEEKRDGHSVSGHYSLVEPDGHRRTVHYRDVGHGFEAHVERDGHSHQEAHHGHNAVYAHAAPVHSVYAHAAPVHHAAVHVAPVHSVYAAHAAPVHHAAIHHGASVYSAPAHHGYASTYGHGHGYGGHASSYQSVNLHHDSHHHGHHY